MTTVHNFTIYTEIIIQLLFIASNFINKFKLKVFKYSFPKKTQNKIFLLYIKCNNKIYIPKIIIIIEHWEKIHISQITGFNANSYQIVKLELA